MMRRYIEYQELLGRFFKAYFLYSKVKYGRKRHTERRLGELIAYKSVMRLYWPLLSKRGRVHSDRVMQRFEQLEEKVRTLPDSSLKKVLLETLMEMDPRRIDEEEKIKRFKNVKK